MDSKKRLRVYVQNVYAGTTRTRVETCARGAGTHWDVFERTYGSVFEWRDTVGGVFSSVKQLFVTFVLHLNRMLGVISYRQFSAYQNLPTYGYHLAQEVHHK